MSVAEYRASVQLKTLISYPAFIQNTADEKFSRKGTADSDG